MDDTLCFVDECCIGGITLRVVRSWRYLFTRQFGQLGMTSAYVMNIGLGSGQYPSTSIQDGTSFTAKSVMGLVDDVLEDDRVRALNADLELFEDHWR